MHPKTMRTHTLTLTHDAATGFRPAATLTLFAALAALLFLTARPAAADAPGSCPASTSAHWQAMVGQQMAASLASTDDAVKAVALQQVAALAACGDEIDLSPAVPGLLEVYKKHTNEQYRLAAVAALHALGNARGMQQLRYYVRWESSARVQHATLAALAAHYGTEARGEDLALLAMNILDR